MAISLAGALYLTPTQENWGMISSAQGLPYKRATAIASDPWNGDIWIGTVRGLSQHDVTTLQQKKVYVAGAPVQFRDQEGVMVAVDDVFGGTLIGTGAPGAAYYYSPTAQTWKTLTVTIDYGQGLPLGYGISGITCITVDKTRGDAWFCDDGGVNHWNPSASQPYTRAMTIKEGLGFAVISAISVVGNNLWVASSAGIYVYDIQSRSLITSYTTANASWLLSNNVFDMEVVGSDFWFGTEGGVSMFNPTTGLTKTITTNTPGSQLPFKAVEKLSIGKDGLLWLGGLECFDGSCNERGGISSPYDTLHDHWVSLPGLPIIDQKLQVNDIFIDDQNSPWFGVTIDNNNRWGLGHYNRKTRTFERFTEQDGLPGPNVYGISPLKDGGLLLAVEGLGRWEIPKPQSDLAIQLQTPAIVVAGTNTVYTLTVTNRGDGDAIDPRVTLTLPPTVTYVSATPSPIVHQMLTWNLPTVTAGSAVTLVINVTVSPEAREGTRLLARATVTSTSPDTFLPDNSEQTVARVRNGVDVGVSLIGPPMVQAGGAISFTVVAENIGGAPAEHVTVTANNGGNCAIPKIEPGQHIACTLTETAPNNAEILSANVRVSTTSGDRDEANNSASTTVAILPKPEPGQPISLPQKSTLILVAPSRLEGSSLVMPLVNQLAQHPTVKGLVVDVTADSNVAAAYQQWDTLPQSSIAANQVVSTIKQLVEQYRRQFPDLHYLVIVGGDHVIPFYRVPDGVQGPEALWQERKYAPYVNANDQAVRAAFDHNMILTDDFLAAPAGGVSVYSSFWTAPNQKTYVPELAVGRLVEHADEIVATLNAFLSGERRFNSAAATVFAEPGLTDDLGRQQCLTLGRDGNCVQSADKLTLGMPAAPTVLLLGAVHSNHHSTGAMELEDSDEFDARFHQRFAQPFIVSIGCHTGLNLADELDLVEAFLRLGGTFIGPTTYAYATEEQMAYSEALAEELTGLLQSGLPPGDALIQAKRKYFTMRAGNNTTLGWFDTLDEKVLLPLTLYGLPMSNGQEAANYRLHGTVAASVQPEQAAVLSTTITLADLDYKLQPQQYYSLIGGKLKRNGDTVTDVEQGQLIVQAGQPIQPGLSLSLPTFITPTVLLQSATYVNHPGLAIKRAQARVIGEADQPALPQLQVTEPVSWDHPLPFAVSFLQATEQQQGEVWLNFALGAFIADSQTERLFSALSLSVLPGDGNRRFDPGLITTGDIASPGEITTMLQARILSWDKPIRVLGVCDIPTGDNAGQYTAVEMIWLPQSQLWQGTCTGIAERFYIQVIDSGNNTTNTPWLLPTGQLLPPLPLQSIYLPMVMTDSGFVDNQQQADDVEQDMTVFLPLITK